MRNPIRSRMAATIRSMFSLPNSTRYQALRLAAVEAARRNNAALWFIENNRSNIFVNADGSGGTPTTGGMVGLLIAPTATRGPNLFVGGDGSSLGTWDLSGPTVVSLENGEIKIVTGSNFGGASRIITTVPGRWYECTATYRSGTGQPCNIFLRPNGKDTTTDQVQFPSTTGLTPLTHTGYIRATTTSMAVRLTSLMNGSPDTCFFDNIVFREVQGHVLSNQTNAQKPTLAVAGSADPFRIGMRFDGTDDRLVCHTSPLSTTVGDPYTLLFAGQLATLSGPRMAVCDGRGLGMDGNGTAASGNTLHGGTTRWGFGQNWPLNALRVLTATYRRTPDLVRQRVNGAEVNSAEIAPTSQITPEMFVGARSSTQEFWQGDIFLACAAPGVMPTADIQAIERFAGFIGGATVA